jgi:hypothetical protein
MNFILERGVESFSAQGIEPEERYINFIFSVFKDFSYEEGERYIGADFDKPEYLKSENFEINKELNIQFSKLGWKESRYQYYISTDQKIIPELTLLPFEKQKDFLISKGIDQPIASYKQTDFVKDQIAVEVQFGKYAFVAFDLFVKHLLFYSGGVINLGIEILPTKLMQSRMSSGIAYYEGEVYNVLRHGRNNPPVPLLILGVEP